MVAQDTIDDISFLSNNYNLGINLNTVNNHNTNTNQVTSTPSIFNSQTANNNAEFAGLDKENGDNYTFEEANKLVQQYPALSYYKDSKIEGGYGVGNKDTAARINALGEELPYNHFANKFPRNVKQGFSGLADGLSKLNNKDTSKMSKEGATMFNYLNLKVKTVPAISNSDINPVKDIVESSFYENIKKDNE